MIVSYPGRQTRREGCAIPDGLQTFLAKVLEEHVIDVTAPTQGSESLPVIDLSFADVKDDAVKIGAFLRFHGKFTYCGIVMWSTTHDVDLSDS